MSPDVAAVDDDMSFAHRDAVLQSNVTILDWNV